MNKILGTNTGGRYNVQPDFGHRTIFFSEDLKNYSELMMDKYLEKFFYQAKYVFGEKL